MTLLLRRISSLAAGVLIAGGLAAAANGQQTGSIAGRVLSADGHVPSDAVVIVTRLQLRQAAGADGSFTFPSLAPGSYLLEAASPRHGRGVAVVEVEAGATASAEILLERHIEGSEIVVTGTAEPRSRLDLAQPVSVLEGDELSLHLQPTLGETLAHEPGINSTYFGPGASRPVIRGLGGDRVRMLQEGLGSGDVSGTSPDHAVSVESGSAARIEVLRGPSTLLYGSSAIGGVVNVIDNSIPYLRASEPIAGSLELRGGSVADELYGGLALDGGGGRWAWHLDGQARDTGDLDIPGLAESKRLREMEEVDGADEEEEEAFGTLPNSDLESQAATLGGSWFGDAGFFGVSAAAFDSLYGIPGAAHHEEEEGEGGEEQVRIDLERRRYDLRGELTRGFGAFQGLKTRIGYTDYQHQELEGSEIGTTFLRDTWEGRLELVQDQRGNLTGSVGLQIARDELEAIGEEAFIPPADTTNFGLFAFEELAAGPLRWQFGARFESSDVSTRSADLVDRSFETVSGSVGVVWPFAEDWSLAASVARSAKAPNAEELFSDGAHVATQQFEVGDPNLDEETSLGFDLSLRRAAGRLTGEVSVFANRFDDFIYPAFTGLEEEGLPVLLYTQDDAEFIGAELDLRIGLWEDGARHVDLQLMSDTVRAELSDTGDPLPRIPPMRYGLGLHYGDDRFQGAVDVRRVEEQDRVVENELPTDGYTTLDASVSYRFYRGSVVYDLLARGTNLTDEEARNHVSFLKDRVPLPGRDLGLALRMWF